MTFLLCCWGPRSGSPPPALPDNQPLHTLRPASALSVALPSNTLPHRGLSTVIDETKALSDIFGASPTSRRGCHEVAKSSASFDTNFQFAAAKPTPPRTKTARQLDQLGHDLRHRFSRSKSSISSSRKSMHNTRAMKATLCSKVLPEIQVSTDLDDLLFSRSVSQGGYDSDARGIETPSSRKASSGSVLIRPESTAKVLHTPDKSPGKESSSWRHPPSDDTREHPSPATSTERLSAKPKSQAYHGDSLIVPGKSQSLGNRSISNPTKPTSAQSDLLPSLLQVKPQESPADVLRRLSIGIANGAIQVPDTPDLKAMQMPSIVEAMPEWRLSFAAPKRASSLHRGDPEVRRSLKLLGDRLEKAKRDGAAGDHAGGNKQFGLVSNLDPAVLDCICDHGHHDSKQKGASKAPCGNEKGNASTSMGSDVRIDNNSSLSEKESVHLFDMRISQRLASTSVFPTVSPSRADLSLGQHGEQGSSGKPGKIDHFPTFLGQTSAEHLRRPSDPQTKRLFEPDNNDNLQVRSKWKPVAATDVRDQTLGEDTLLPRKHAESTHMCDHGRRVGEGKKSIAGRRHQSDSHPNPNSLAVAGRKGIQATFNGQEETGPGPEDADSKSKDGGEIKSCFLVGGKESDRPDELGYRQKMPYEEIEADTASTSGSEKSSIIDFLKKIGPRKSLNEGTNEVDCSTSSDEQGEGFASRRNDQRDLEHKDNSALRRADEPSAQLSPTQETNIVSRLEVPEEVPRSVGRRGSDGSASDLWERALRLARTDRSFASSDHRLRSTFGQLRKCQSRSTRLSGNQGAHEHADGALSASLSPHAAATISKPRESFDLDKHQSLCVDVRRPLTQPTSQPPPINAEKTKFFGVGKAERYGDNSPVNLSPAATTPAKDFLSWTRFPSHTWYERNGPAGHKDGVLTKDFSAPLNSDALRLNCSKLSLMTQPVESGGQGPGSWRFFGLGHARRKSRSMDFADVAPSSQVKGKAGRFKSPVLKLKSFAKWKNLYRSRSNDLRTLMTTHRSSVSKGESVEYPELEVVPGYDGVGSGEVGRMRLEEIGDHARQSWKTRGLESQSLGKHDKTKPRISYSSDDLPKTVQYQKLARADGKGTTILDTALARSSVSESAYCSDGAIEQPPSRSRGLPSVDGGGHDWADIYLDCVQQHDDKEEESDDYDGKHLNDPPPTPLSFAKTATPYLDLDGLRKLGGLGHTCTDSGDSYVSCSVGLSDDDLGTDDSRPRNAAVGKHGDDGPVQTRLLSSLSSEMRDSTLDFRTKLQEEERRARKGLLESRVGINANGAAF